MLRALDPKKNFGAPKPRKDMSPDELHYVDVVAPEREMGLSIARYQAKVAREQILRAAQADNAK